MEILDFIADVIATLIESVAYTVFLNSYWQYKGKNKYIISTILTTLFFIMGFFFGDYIVFPLIVYPVIMTGYCMLFLGGSFRPSLGISLAILVITALINVSTMLVTGFLTNYSDMTMVLNTGLPRILSLAINRIFFVAVFYTLIHMLNGRQRLAKEEWTLIGLYLFADIIIATVFVMWMMKHNFDKDDYVFAFLILGPILVITLVSLELIKRMSRKNEYEKQTELMNLKLQAERQDIVRVNKEYDDIRKARHDMVKHLNIYMRLLNDENYEELKQALREHIDDCGKNKCVYITGNNLINAVINEKVQLCSQRNIELEVKATALVDEKKELDVAVMLSNLLDNAVEAQDKIEEGKRKYISLNIFSYRNKYCILVKNTIAKSVLLYNPGFVTNKKDGNLHGIGMKSIEETVEKNGGYIEKYEEGDLFCIHIMI